ncbi:MAG: hypothetical protein JW987_12285 [Anaerolineaceae bacterium]|nr:hypothetical protein [Anaerolineaceae bacterium]
MLLITADIFSGRPNPGWTLTDEKLVKTALREIARNRDLVLDSALPEAVLGFRGVVIEPLSDELAKDFDVPSSMYIALGADKAAKGAEIAEWLISLIPKSEMPVGAGPDTMALDESLQGFLQSQLDMGSRMATVDGAEAVGAVESAEEAQAICYYDLTPYNPGFWNTDANVRLHNNCYHYASNKRRNSFRVLPGGGQPGAGCGHMYTALTCAEVTRAALCDGLHRRYNCFPDTEYPRHLVALVIWPGNDFHWYRKQREGYWAHKPGSTAVRNVDNRNIVIANPAACDRGPYTEFCGYFYTCRSQRIV